MENIPIKQSTLLWADDDPDELALMREVSHELGSPYHIIEATNGCEVLQYLEHAKDTDVLPCLIVLDLNMPVLSGKETLVRLKQHCIFKNIPTVVLTNSESPIDQRFCALYGTEMLTKPLTYAALKEIIQKLLDMCEVSVKGK